MAKRRTTIIIEEIVGEDKSTKVFVSGNNAETLTEAKNITPRKNSAKTSTKNKTTSKKTKTTSKAAKKSTSANLKNKTTKSKTTSKAKSTSKATKKKSPNNKTKTATKSRTTNTKVQNKDTNNSNSIEKSADFNYIQENQNKTIVEEEANTTSTKEVHEPSEIAQSTSLEPVAKQEISLTNKEVINNPEIIDKEDNKENIDLDFTDKDKKPDPEVLNAKVTIKENKEEPIEDKKEVTKDDDKEESLKQNDENQKEEISASSNIPATSNEENKVTKVESNSLIDNESNNKEKVDVEVIDSESKNEAKETINKEEFGKPEAIDVDVVDKTDDKEDEKSGIDNTENGKNSDNQISTTFSTISENNEKIMENSSDSSTSTNSDTLKEEKQEIKESKNDTKDETKVKKSSRFKISLNPLSLIAKLFKNKTYRGAIIGTSLLVILVAILVPVSINANKETKELSENEFNSLKDSFIKEDEFFSELTSLSFTFSQLDQENLNTTIIKLDYEYTFDGSYYSSNLKSYDAKENEPSIYNINFDKEINSYTLTTSLNGSVEPVALNEKEAIQIINENSSSYFKDYLSFNSSFVSSLLEDEALKLTYEQNKKSEDLRIFDKENGLFDIKLDSLGIVTSLKVYDKNNKDKPLYSLDTTYTFNE